VPEEKIYSLEDFKAQERLSVHLVLLKNKRKKLIREGDGKRCGMERKCVCVYVYGRRLVRGT
jgi:hypothetical protein